MKLNILGTEYELVIATEKAEPYMAQCDGCCDTSVKKLFVKDFRPTKDEVGSLKDLQVYARKVARHEMVHAFLYESGLSVNSDWATNEELVDWIAIQLPKMANLMAEIDQLDLMPEGDNNGMETV